MSVRRLRTINVAIKGALVGVIAVIAYAAYWLHERPMVGCNTFANPVSKNQAGYSIVLVQTLCDGIASSDDMSVDLYSPSGRRSTVFAFEAAHSLVRNGRSADPEIVWIDQNTLKISIGRVGSVRKKLAKVGDIQVLYDIETTTYK